MSELLKKITDLTAGTPGDNDVIPYVDLVAGATKKALKSELKGTDGTDGDSAFVYIAYASDDSGTGFTMTFNASLNYIAIKSTTTAISSPQASDFVGLWKNYKGASGTNGTDGTDGVGITSIVKTSTVGLVDTYTITFTDSSTTTYDVTNGADGTDGTDGQSCNWKGAWVTSTAYVLQDIVSINSAAYVCVTAHTSGTFATDLATGKWEIACKGIYWRGAYDNGTAYTLNDGVSYNGSSYVCIADTTGNLPTDTSYWNVLAAKGTDGTGAGDVSGPASSTDNNIAVFDGLTGKLIKDGGATVASKVTANAGITGATKTKITYDAKGLVTAGEDATTADIADSSNKRYVTDANLTAIGTIGDKAPSASPTFTGTVILPKAIEIQDTSADHQYVLAVNELTADRTVTLPLLTGNDEFTFKDHTQTLTKKRINPRLVTATSYTTDTGTSLDVSTCDQFEITAQAGALKLNNPSGTPLGGQKLIVRIKDNGTARALTYDTQFRAMGNALPSTTVVNKTLYLGFIYNATDTKWDLVAVAQEA